MSVTYDLHWGTTSGSRTNVITNVTLPYTHGAHSDPLTNGTTYYYSLVANNGPANSESTEVSGTPVGTQAYFANAGFESALSSSSPVGNWLMSATASDTVCERLSSSGITGATGSYVLHMKAYGSVDDSDPENPVAISQEAFVIQRWSKASIDALTGNVSFDVIPKQLLTGGGYCIVWVQACKADGTTIGTYANPGSPANVGNARAVWGGGYLGITLNMSLEGTISPTLALNTKSTVTFNLKDWVNNKIYLIGGATVTDIAYVDIHVYIGANGPAWSEAYLDNFLPNA
jgi:hypothetical protein